MTGREALLELYRSPAVLSNRAERLLGLPMEIDRAFQSVKVGAIGGVKTFGLMFGRSREWLHWLAEQRETPTHLYAAIPDRSRLFHVSTAKQAEYVSENYGSGGSLDWLKVAKGASGLWVEPFWPEVALGWYRIAGLAFGLAWQREAFSAVRLLATRSGDSGFVVKGK